MKNDELIFEDDIIMHVFGSDSPGKRSDTESYIKHSKGEERKNISGYNEIVSMLSVLLKNKPANPVPSEGVKKSLLVKIKEKKSADSTIHNHGFEFIYSDSPDWIQHPVEGIEIKKLSQNLKKGYTMLLMKVKPGTEYPSHVHNGAEECFVIEGDVVAEGKILGPGDFHHAEAGSRHGTLFTKNGCTLLLVVDNLDL